MTEATAWKKSVREIGFVRYPATPSARQRAASPRCPAEVSIRRGTVAAPVPRPLLTSAGQRGDAARCRAIGVAGYLTKPISRTDFFQAVASVIRTEPSGPSEALVTRHTLSEARRNLKILLAEDNVVNQEVAATMLRRRGHQVDVVGDGTERSEERRVGK